MGNETVFTDNKPLTKGVAFNTVEEMDAAHRKDLSNPEYFNPPPVIKRGHSTCGCGKGKNCER